MERDRSDAYADNHVTLGCFEVAGRVYAVDVTQMREVVRWQAITPLPSAPRLIEGVIDLRGTVIPVVDLAKLLELGVCRPDAKTRIVISEIEGLVMGMVVESATDVMPVSVERLEDPPALALQTGYDVVRAIVRRSGEEPILVLSLENLLERVYRSALPEHAADPETAR